MHIDKRKKPSPDFVIRLVGADLRPWLLPTRKLSRVLDAVQRLLDQLEPEPIEGTESSDVEQVSVEPNEPPIFQDNDRAIRLIGVTSGSAAYRVATPQPEIALRLIRDTGEGIVRPSNTPWTQPTLSALRDLSDIAKSLSCGIELRLPGLNGKGFGDILATISPTTYHNVARSAFISGDTTIFATIERVGGATAMHCGVRIPSQANKMVICKVESEPIIHELGKCIYQQVTLTGKATWLRHNSDIVKFDIHSVEKPKTGSILEALRRIRDAGGSAWDQISTSGTNESVIV